MVSKEDHLAEAAKNQALAGRLTEMNEYGWATTLLFYSAVHLVEAYLVGTGTATSNHAARDARMKRQRPLREVVAHYDRLTRVSEDARYNCVVPTHADFERLRIRYGRLQGHMQRLLS
jgi:hypothetical protein